MLQALNDVVGQGVSDRLPASQWRADQLAPRSNRINHV